MKKRIIAFCFALLACSTVFTAGISTVSAMPNALYYSGAADLSEITECRGEGKVIAVIDTELNTEHEMFSAIDDKKVRYTKDDISKIISSPDFNGSSDVDSVYVNSKIPYAFCYTYDDPNIGGQEFLYHGTHVSGIAAGNRTEYEGIGISGAAPDAQIIFMSVGTRGTGEETINYEAMLRAFEDALKLDVDVINMSFGSSYEHFFSEDRFAELCEEAERKGIIICRSSGNDSFKTTSPVSPDRAAIADYSDFESVFSVANSSRYCSTGNPSYFIGDIPFHYDYMAVKRNGIYENTDIAELLGSSTFSTVVIYDEDFTKGLSEEEISGKIVFFYTEIETDNEQFNKICREFSDKGAAGLIFIPYGNYHNYYFDEEIILPCALQYSPDGLDLGKYKDIVFKSSDEVSKILENSSYGVLSSLILVPDISAPGTSVISAAYDNSYQVESGTSMSSPFMAGCCAVILEYLEKTAPDMPRTDRVKTVKNLIMCSAVPDKTGEIYTTPRQQGAGIVNLNNLMNDKVIITGTEGDAKISAGDMLEDDFEITINISNISSEDVCFSDAGLYLTTDTVESEEDEICVSGIQSLKATADVSSLKTIKAGETRTETVRVSLDKEQSEKLYEDFINGFFIDGFIVLSGADNCCDISVPLTGFHGDYFNGTVNFYVDDYGTLPPVTALSKMKSELDKGKGAAAEEEMNREIKESSNFYFSGNFNGFYDHFPLYISRFKPCFLTEEITDLSGEKDSEKIFLDDCDNYDYIGYSLNEGSYQLTFSAFTRLKRLMENPYQISRNVLIDFTQPEAVFREYEKEGRKMLSVNSSDINLDGFAIIGKYKSDITEVHRYDSKDMSNLFTISSRITGGIFDNDTNHYSQFQKLMQNVYYGPEPEDYDFIDCVTADSDKLLLDYDITDFEYYSVIVADKCGNMMTYELNPENIGLSSGTWIFDDLFPYVLVINDDNTSGKLVSLTDSSAYEISIRKENNFYNIYNDHNEKIGTADVFSGNKIKFTLFEEEISAVCKFYNANQNMFFYDDAKINELTEKFISEKFSDYKVTKTHFQEGFDTVYLNYTLEKDSSEEYLGMEVSRTSGKFSYLFDSKETDECLYLYDSDILKGDTDNNGLINVIDFIILKKYILGYSNIEVIPHFDINSDGKINVMDLGVLKRMMLAG